MKKCSKCKVGKENNCFSKRKSSKDGLNGTCKNCCSLVFKNWSKKNTDKQIKRAKAWRLENKSHVKNYGNEYNKNRSLDCINKNRKNQVKNLSDSYVKGILKNENKIITPELIEIKRLTIKINRFTKL